MALTGRFWFKRTWGGKLRLLVEEKKPRRQWFFKRGSEFTLRWREARLLDLAEVAMGPLVDLGRLQRAGMGSVRPAGPRLVEVPTLANTARSA